MTNLAEVNRNRKTTTTKYGWSTHDELDFLSQLGTGLLNRNKTNRRELLLKYQRTMINRVNWGKIDKKEIVKYLEGGDRE